MQPPPWLHHPDRNGDATTQVTPWAWPCPTHPEIWHLVPSQQLLEKAVSPQSSSHPSLKMRGRGCMGRKDTHLLPVTWSPALVTEQGALGCTSRSLVSPSRCPRAVPTSPSGALTALELLVAPPPTHRSCNFGEKAFRTYREVPYGCLGGSHFPPRASPDVALKPLH